MSRVGRFSLAVVLALFACGRVDGGSDDSNESDGTGGVDSAGGSASGGQANPSAGGTSSGGVAHTTSEPWGPCQQHQYVGLEPPCSESDVHGLLSSCGLWFDVPLAQIVPPAPGLQVALLPLGLGGMGGVPTEPYPLDPIYVVPWEASDEASNEASGDAFDLVLPASSVRAIGYPPPGYATDPAEAGYGIAEVALLQGTETLSVHRGLFSVTPDLCVK